MVTEADLRDCIAQSKKLLARGNFQNKFLIHSAPSSTIFSLGKT